MFGLQLRLPEYLNVSTVPNPKDQGHTYLLTIEGRMSEDQPPFRLEKAIPRDVSAIQFGKDLMQAVNHIRDHLVGKQ